MAIENYINSLNKIFEKNSGSILLLITIGLGILLIITIRSNMKLSKTTKMYKTLMEGTNGENLERLLMRQARRTDDISSEIADMKRAIAKMAEENREMIKKVAWKRYNAFSDMGSDLSFSLALLNDKNHGVIITSIYGRDENRIYLKPVNSGKSSYTLSPEEEEVIMRALSNKNV